MNLACTGLAVTASNSVLSIEKRCATYDITWSQVVRDSCDRVPRLGSRFSIENKTLYVHDRVAAGPFMHLYTGRQQNKFTRASDIPPLEGSKRGLLRRRLGRYCVLGRDVASVSPVISCPGIQLLYALSLSR